MLYTVSTVFCEKSVGIEVLNESHRLATAIYSQNTWEGRQRRTPAPRKVNYLVAGLAIDPSTIRSLSMLKTPGVELACIPASALSLSFRTTP